MFLTCKCLNITIKIRDNCELKPIKVGNYRGNNHQHAELSHTPIQLSFDGSTASTTDEIVAPSNKINLSEIPGDFFHHNLVTIPSSLSRYEIIKQQDCLIDEKTIDNWIINRCINCMMYTHAINDKFTNISDNNNDNSTSNCDNNKETDSYNNYQLLINVNMILPTDDNSNDIDNNVSNYDNYEKLKANVRYSKIYNIIIDKNFNNVNNDRIGNYDNDNDDEDDEYNLLLKKKLSGPLQFTISNLQQQYEMGYQGMKEKIDEKIKKFATEQYEYLDEFKEQGHKEYRTLVNRLFNSDLMPLGNVTSNLRDSMKYKKYNLTSESVIPIDKNALPAACFVVLTADSVLSARLSALSMKEGLLSTDQSFLSSEGSVLPTGFGKINSFEETDQNDGDLKSSRFNKGIGERRMEEKSKKKDKKRSFKDNEEEVIFPLEGMDDSDNGEVSEDENDTDDSGQDEGIHIPRGQRGGHPTIAKSLPVSVPNFSFGHRVHDQSDDQLSMDPLDPHNIRASIKALAKSVHGDTVFGDLPRPRFSTQI